MEVANLVILLSCLWIWNPASVSGRTDSSDASALNTLFSSLNSRGQLSGWTESGGDPCGDSWKGITCSDSSVTAIQLSGLGLTGTFYNLNSMTSLVELDMSNNNLGNGDSIPYNLPPNLKRLNLASNQFTKGIPYSISQMASLEYLNLGRNHLQSIGDMFYNLPKLATVDLSFNSISGDRPQSFSALSSLTTLYLQNNQFTGSINVLASLPLNDFCEQWQLIW